MSKKYWREYTAETEAKHAVLKQYLGTFGKVLGPKASVLFYIDGFAGKGRHDTGEEGSPLIALRVADELARKGLATMHLAFVEADSANYESLVKEVGELKTSFPMFSLPFCDVESSKIRYSTYCNKDRKVKAPRSYSLTPLATQIFR